MIVSDQQIVSISTHRGVQLNQFLPTEQMSLAWSRELRQTSTCELVVPTQFAAQQFPNLQPWTQWVSVWDGNGQDMLWRGPIQGITADRRQLTITSSDPSAYYRKTRTPLTKRWEAVDLSVPAEALWHQMAEDKAINVDPIVRPDPLGDRFDIDLVRDQQLVEQDFNDLVQKGLRWSVVAGVPILGPLPYKAVAALGEDDFLGNGVQLHRDGSQTANDVLLRAADQTARARVNVVGQNLQTIVNADSIFGVSNAEKAVRQYVRYTGTYRDTLVVPEDTQLHPNAPVTIAQLMPSARFHVEAYGLLSLMELRSVKVSVTSGTTTVAVSMDSVNDDLPELAELQQKTPGAIL
ncbi:minor tail protein [Mycobacterium phage Sabella]|uniref:Minor tail protein n=2 Tax=Rosebushvirus rosebush TaxID=2006145 RepID=A0A2L0HKM4_9CAUD|nr:minor tail protein [Mycobacterium phage ItsyBitsy1]AXH69041.1 minor tail protein [Mycobacterium phage Sabella]